MRKTARCGQVSAEIALVALWWSKRCRYTGSVAGQRVYRYMPKFKGKEFVPPLHLARPVQRPY